MIVTCRLCLLVPNGKIYDLTEEILIKLKTSLSHQIQINNDLPKEICADCYAKVEDTFIFYETIVQNEIILQKKISESLMTDPISVKTETNEDCTSNECQKVIEENPVEDTNNIFDDFVENDVDNSIKSDCSEVDDKEDLKSIKLEYEISEEFGHRHRRSEIEDKESENKEITNIINCGVENIDIKNIEGENQELDSFKIEDNENPNNVIPFNNMEVEHFKNIETEAKELNKTKNTERKTVRLKIKDIKELTNKESKSLNNIECVNQNLKDMKSLDSEALINEVKTNETVNSNLVTEEVLLYQKFIAKGTDGNICLTCFQSFPDRMSLLHHYQDVERHKHKKNEKKENKNVNFKYKIVPSDGVDYYKCEQCGKQYKNINFIKRHFLTHQDRPFLCKLCGRTYRTAIEIANHGKVHSSCAVFVCSYKCGYSSVHKHVVMAHEKIHTNDFKYTCDTCGKRFQVKTWFLQHQNIHTGVRPYVCDICGKAYHIHRYLTQHKTTSHPQATTQKRYVCMHCSIPCSSKYDLALHLKDHNINTHGLCDECGKVFKTVVQLQKHKRTHTGTKPFKCRTCDRSYSKKSNLVVHERHHTGERFSCEKCQKKFMQRSSMNRHLKKCRGHNNETSVEADDT